MGLAEYRSQPIEEWEGNPFIEALPPLMDDDDVYAALSTLPKYDESARSKPKVVRQHELFKLLRVFVPLPRHQRVALAVSRMIREGYVARNPMRAGYWQHVRGRIEAFSSTEDPASKDQRDVSASLGAALIGISGIGKTTCLDGILRTYPQVIEHGVYQGVSLNIRQVTHVRLQMPPAGSIKGLCESFMQILGGLLGTDYHARYGKGTVDNMMLAMAHLAALHAIGLIVIDETQELSSAKSGGADLMLGFFLRLNNSIGVPILLIGTYRSFLVLNGQLRHRRRLNALGLPEWKPLAWGEEFDAVVDVLWRYQYTREVTELTPDLKERLYYESQGITDFVVKLFLLAQDRLISTNRDGVAGAITPELISTVAKTCLHNAQPVLDALRAGDWRRLQELDDIPKRSIDEMLELLKSGHVKRPDGEPSHSDDRSGPEGEERDVDDPVQPAPEPAPAEKPGSKARSRGRRRGGTENSEPGRLECVLRDLLYTGDGSKGSGYTSLKAAGYVKSPEEFLGDPE